MTERDWQDFVNDIITNIESIERFTVGLNEEKFLENEMIQKAVLYCLAVIGEAVKKLPPEVKAAHSEIPWKAIAGNRDKIIHAYFGTELSIVWNTVQDNLRSLKEPLKKIRQR